MASCVIPKAARNTGKRPGGERQQPKRRLFVIERRLFCRNPARVMWNSARRRDRNIFASPAGGAGSGDLACLFFSMP